MNISKKKLTYSIPDSVLRYLSFYGRLKKLPLSYDALKRYKESFALDATLWQTVIYSPEDAEEINAGLCYIYSLLRTSGNLLVMKHLRVDRVDLCMFGNSQPFRVRIINDFNDNYDYFYVKKADLSRVIGLEMEDLLSPNKISYYVDNNTLIEEHITGIPGDEFIINEMKHPKANKTRLAKEFIKFNERCFFTLLGDMRSYNFVVELTHDFDGMQYRIRSIDFDQQCYEGRARLYLPQFYKENLAYVNMVMSTLNKKSIVQYQSEERSRLASRIKHARYILKDLFDVIAKEILSPEEKVRQLGHELAKYHNVAAFKNCKTMAELLRQQLLLLDFDE
jgi:hypothetical protein